MIILSWSDKSPCQTEAAQQQYQDKAAELKKSETRELVSLADWCVRNELEDQAEDVLERALKVDPSNPAVLKLQKKVSPSRLRGYSTDAELILADGSQLRATLRLHHLKVETPYGRLSFPPKNVGAVGFKMAGDMDVVLADDLTICGKVKLGNVHAQTKAGRIQLDRTTVKTLRLLRPCLTCKRTGKVRCDRCKGLGKISEESPCPICNGVDSKKPCENCKGTGRIVCQHCGGQGTWLVNMGGFMVRHRCAYCKGKGWLKCKFCHGRGAIHCAGCDGAGVITQRIECPKCHGEKKVACPDCQGEGYLPTPELVWPIPCEPVTREPRNETAETP